MDFFAFPGYKGKEKAAPPPPPPPTPPPPPPPPRPPTLPEFMQHLPRVPGSRNLEMLFRWNYGDGMNGYHGQHPGYYGQPSRGMGHGPFTSMALPPPQPMHHHMGLPGPPPLPLGGMHGPVQPFGQGMMSPFGQGMSEYDYDFDPYGPPPPYHYGY